MCIARHQVGGTERHASERSTMRLEGGSRHRGVLLCRTLWDIFLITMFESRSSQSVVQDWMKSRGISSVGFQDSVREWMASAFL